MGVTVTHNNTRETHYYDRSIEFDGGSPILLKRNYSHGGKQFVPDIALARWKHGDAIEHITVKGFVLKKDGLPGNQRTELEFITPANRWFGQSKNFTGPEAPAWLLELFDIEVPKP